jgi:hypothetical protein
MHRTTRKSQPDPAAWVVFASALCSAQCVLVVFEGLLEIVIFDIHTSAKGSQTASAPSAPAGPPVIQ